MRNSPPILFVVLVLNALLAPRLTYAGPPAGWGVTVGTSPQFLSAVMEIPADKIFRLQLSLCPAFIVNSASARVAAILPDHQLKPYAWFGGGYMLIVGIDTGEDGTGDGGFIWSGAGLRYGGLKYMDVFVEGGWLDINNKELDDWEKPSWSVGLMYIPKDIRTGKK